jgi:altronate dehydratase
MVDAIIDRADERLAALNRRRRECCPASDLVVGVQCGGSDACSGVTANPAVGFASDLLVRAGATVMFSEVTEVRDAVHLLTLRAIHEDVGRALIREMAWYEEYLAAGDATVEEVGWELFRMILEVASGTKKPWADEWGLHNARFNPAPVTRLHRRSGRQGRRKPQGSNVGTQLCPNRLNGSG